jgi:hypothetical protein
MRAFAAAWPEPEVVQGGLAQLPWYHHIALLEKLDSAELRQWYAAAALEGGWSRDILALQIDGRLHERAGKAITNFSRTVPEDDSDLPGKFDPAFLGQLGMYQAAVDEILAPS